MHRLFVFIPAVLLLYLSCNPDSGFDCFTSTGKIVTEEYPLQDFQTIQLNNLFTVYLQQDTVNKLVFKAGKNIMPKLGYSINDTTLSVYDKNFCDFINPYDHIPQVTIHFKSFSLLQCFGQVNMYSVDTIRGNYITVQMKTKISNVDLTFDTYVTNFQLWNSTGNFYLRGKTTNTYFINYGTGYLFAEDLKVSDEALISANSTGDTHMQSGKVLIAIIKNKGEIYYYGTPDSVNIERMGGTGKLIQKQP